VRNNDGQWVADCGSASGLAQARHHHPASEEVRPGPDRHRQLSANLEPDFSVEGRGTSGGHSAQHTPLHIHKWAATALSVGVHKKHSTQQPRCLMGSLTFSLCIMCTRFQTSHLRVIIRQTTVTQ